MKNKKIIFSIGLFNILLITVLIYMISKAVIPQEEQFINTNPLGAKIEMIGRTYTDKKTGIKLSVVESKSYYPQGQIAIESIEINNMIYSAISYKPDGTILGKIHNYKGRYIVPKDINGNVNPKDTVFPQCDCNCYYDYGAFLTEEEFKQRSNEKHNKEFKKFLKSAHKSRIQKGKRIPETD
jgi:hypothetical protein